MKKTILNEYYSEDEDTLELIKAGLIVRDDSVNEEIDEEGVPTPDVSGRRIVKIPLTVE